VTEVAKRLTVDKNGKNATEDGFDRTQIVQLGYNAQWQSILSVGTFYAGATKVFSGEKKGEYKSSLPDSWKEAYRWYYDGMWGKQPFMANGPLSGAPEFGAGNVFASGKAAMGLTQTWYTCCLADFAKAGNEFQLGIQPMGADGKVHGRVDADTFRILKGSKSPKEAFEVFDNDKDGYILSDEIGTVIRALGKCPTEAEIDSVLKDMPEDINFTSFKGVYQNRFPSPQGLDAKARSILQMLDPNNDGLMKESDFRQMLSTIGEPMDHAEVDLLMEDCVSNANGFFRYEEFVTLMVTGFMDHITDAQ